MEPEWHKDSSMFLLQPIFGLFLLASLASLFKIFRGHDLLQIMQMLIGNLAGIYHAAWVGCHQSVELNSLWEAPGL